MELVEFVADESDIKPEVKILVDPCQFDGPLQVGLPALAIQPPLSSSSLSVGKGPAAAAAPSRFQEPWGIQNQSQGRIPEGELGPADPPRRRRRPKGSKSRPRVQFSLSTLPERQEKLWAEEQLAEMSSK